MRCALVDNATNIVVNLIMANPDTDPAPPGFSIIGIPDDSPVAIGWSYDPASGTFSPPLE